MMVLRGLKRRRKNVCFVYPSLIRSSLYAFFCFSSVYHPSHQPQDNDVVSKESHGLINKSLSRHVGQG